VEKDEIWEDVKLDRVMNFNFLILLLLLTT